MDLTTLSEHDRKMVELVESSGSQINVSDSSGQRTTLPNMLPQANQPAEPATQPAAHIKPEHVPEKFWNAETGVVNTEALLKSYTELERARTALAAKPAVAPVVGPTAEQKAAIDTASAALAAATTDEAKATAQAQLDAANSAVATEAPKVETPSGSLNDAMQLAADSFTASGEISEEAFVALEKAGITRDYATQYATGLKAQAELVEVKMYAEVGGKETYSAMHAWAQEHLSEAQKTAYNATLNGTLDASLGAARNLKALYEAANGRAPGTQVTPQGGSEAATTKAMFRSEAEITAAMGSEKYRTDPAFRKEVQDKMLASMNAGLDLLPVAIG